MPFEFVLNLEVGNFIWVQNNTPGTAYTKEVLE